MAGTEGQSIYGYLEPVSSKSTSRQVGHGRRLTRKTGRSRRFTFCLLAEEGEKSSILLLELLLVSSLVLLQREQLDNCHQIAPTTSVDCGFSPLYYRRNRSPPHPRVSSAYPRDSLQEQ